MANVILVTGGARSGKSAYSETLAKSFNGSRAYIATCPVMDEEMARRVERHQQQRGNDGWTTIEEERDLAGVIRQSVQYDTILVDCLTLWISNLMYHAGRAGGEVSEDRMLEICADLKLACMAHAGNIIFVINEVGLGIVPDNAQARLFRDLSGRCSQEIARFAAKVVLVVCGLPLVLKEEQK
ncbi:MAG: bifunctional adenosylcobinamide kinase/adenosylcobinamide-phosphate guanylyltransferase [Victivallaceae bacterium]|jgi:adenosylcobinamide kinase/adenosylcobinamide-phosphate guanylyltransferase